MNETFFTKLKDRFTKKSFIITFDGTTYAMPSIHGFTKPDVREIQLAIERYCIKNKYKLNYLSMEEPIVFTLDEKETYYAEVMLVQNRFMYEYVIKCLEV